MTKKQIGLTIFCSFVCLGAVGYLVFSSPNLPINDDGYRHIKTAFLYRTEEFSKTSDFTWLAYSLPHPGADIWLLFHLLLIPFTFGSLLFGAKLATIVFNMAIIYLYCRALGTLEVKQKWLWILILYFSSSYFLFRLTFPRSLLLDLVFFLIGIIAILKQRYWTLLTASILFTLGNVASLLLVAMAFIYDLSARLTHNKTKWLATLTTISGVIICLFLHPQFPANFSIFFDQLFGSLLLPAYVHIPVGAELSAYGLQTFLIQNWILITVAMFAFLHVYISRDTDSKTSNKHTRLWLGTATLLLLMATLLHKRFIEFLGPVSILFSAPVIESYFAETDRQHTKSLFKHHWQLTVGSIIILIVLCLGFYQSFTKAKVDTHSSISSSLYRPAASWMEIQDPDTLVLNTQWDQFPQLLFWNSHNTYALGIDPTFSYHYYPGLYWKWRKITDEIPTAWTRETVYLTIKKDFGAKFVFLENSRNPKLLEYLISQPQDFTLGFQDTNTTVFQVN